MAEVGLYPVAGHYLGGGSSKVFRGKAGVIANNQPPVCQVCLLEILGYCLSTSPHVIEGKVLSDNPSPAVSAEFYQTIYLLAPFSYAGKPLFLLLDFIVKALFRQQVAKIKRVFEHRFSQSASYPLFEYWPGKDKGVELPILTPGVCVRRKLR